MASLFFEPYQNKKPFKQLEVVLKKQKRFGYTAHVRQGGLLGSNLLPRGGIETRTSAEQVVTHLLSGMCDGVVFQEI